MTAEAGWRWAFVAYVLAQMIVRVLTGPSLELDEAEALVFGQRLAWGYGPQPPLYFWLQWAFLQVLGETVLALAALKAVLLGATLVLTFELMRRAVATAVAGAATLSLSLLPQVAWESQRALTNSVLALALAVAAALLFLRMLERGRRRDHLAWGAVAALAVLGKVNVAAWLLGLLLAAALRPDWRRRLRPLRLALAAAAAAVVLAGPVAWMLANPDLATDSVGKFAIEADTLAGARGLGALALAALSFNALGLLAVGLAWAQGRARGTRPGAPSEVALLATAVGVSLALVAAGVLASGTTEVRDRWLLPLSWALVPAAVAWVWPALTDRARRTIAGVAASLWIVVAAALPYASLVDPGYRGSDWTGMEAALRAEGAGSLPVVAADTWAAGNLLLRDQVPEPLVLGRVGELPRAPVILVARSGAAVLDDPAVAARTRSTRALDVPHGTGARSYVVARLAQG